MKYILIISMVTLLVSCSSGHRLFERVIADNEKVIVKEGIFSGIHYINFENRAKNKVRYYIYLDCECDDENKLSLRKGIYMDDGDRTLWNAVTDTTKGEPVFFDKFIKTDRLFVPAQFVPIESEELSMLEEGVRRSNTLCCKITAKPINKIIGYVRVKLN